MRSRGSEEEGGGAFYLTGLEGEAYRPSGGSRSTTDFLADGSDSASASGAVLTGHQPDVGFDLVCAVKTLGVVNDRNEARRNQGTHTWCGAQVRDDRLLVAQLPELFLNGAELWLDDVERFE